MKKSLTRRLPTLLICLSLLIAPGCATRSPPVAAPVSPDFQKGLTFVSWQSGEYASAGADEALARLAATGANWVAILVTVYQDAPSDLDLASTVQTPTDADLRHAIDRAHSLGLKVLLKPHVDLLEPGRWRGEISFSSEADWEAWFDSYRGVINHYAGLSQGAGVEAFCIGTELAGTSGRARDWERVAAEVRDRFGGQLTYAANFDEVGQVGWWQAVDAIGVDAYYPLPVASLSPGVDDFKQAWIDQGHLAALAVLSDRFGRPVLLTEIGYRPVVGANTAPWEWQSSPEIDLRLQADLYQAALETFFDQPWAAGMFFWNWPANPSIGRGNDPDFTPHRKPAEAVLKAFYTGAR